MANLEDLGTIAADSNFQNRCMNALMAYVENTVLTEGDGVANHAQREAYALTLQNSQNAISPRVVAETILTNPTIAAEATTASLPGCTAVPDSDIEYAITTVFNDLAGVST
jgi:hypothetical protein